MSETKRGSNGGNARKEKLSKDRRREIAQEAAKKRWAKKKETPVVVEYAYVNQGTGEKTEPSPIPVPFIYKEDPKSNPESFGETESTQEPKHCPACLNGQNIEKGEGTHLLLTVEHPYDPGPSVSQLTRINNSPSPAEKGRKRASKEKPVSKVYGKALSVAEKEYEEAVEELVFHDEMAARLKAKMPRLIQTIRVLGGTIDPQVETAEFNRFNHVSGPQSSVNFGYTPSQQPVFNNPMKDMPEIEQSLYLANSGPVPRQNPVIQPAERIGGEPFGGAVDLM